MIKVHHLEQSRSLRIIWLMEELGVDYEIVYYYRDPVTSRGPDSLKDVHPLGKAPLAEDDGKVIAESGAIVEYFARKYGNESFAPGPEADNYVDYLHWMHFAEGSGAFPLVMEVLLEKTAAQAEILGLFIKDELNKMLTFIDDTVGSHGHIAGADFTAADTMMSFVLSVASGKGYLEGHPNSQAYLQRLVNRPAYLVAVEKGDGTHQTV